MSRSTTQKVLCGIGCGVIQLFLALAALASFAPGIVIVSLLSYYGADSFDWKTPTSAVYYAQNLPKAFSQGYEVELTKYDATADIPVAAYFYKPGVTPSLATVPRTVSFENPSLSFEGSYSFAHYVSFWLNPGSSITWNMTYSATSTDTKLQLFVVDAANLVGVTSNPSLFADGAGNRMAYKEVLPDQISSGSASLPQSKTLESSGLYYFVVTAAPSAKEKFTSGSYQISIDQTYFEIPSASDQGEEPCLLDEVNTKCTREMNWDWVVIQTNVTGSDFKGHFNSMRMHHRYIYENTKFGLSIAALFAAGVIVSLISLALIVLSVVCMSRRGLLLCNACNSKRSQLQHDGRNARIVAVGF